MDTPFELILLEECQPFLEEFKKIYLSGTKLPLRRGMTIQINEHIQKIKVKKDRKPTNSNIRVHEASDQWFLKKFGVKARSQSFFCTSSRSRAKDYGFPFFVFPSGNFEVIWSRQVDDLFFMMTERKLVRHATGQAVSTNEAKEMISDPNQISDKLLYDTVSYFLDSFDYVKGNLDQALASRNEIMVICDHYYIANDNDEIVKQFMIDYIKGNV